MVRLALLALLLPACGPKEAPPQPAAAAPPPFDQIDPDEEFAVDPRVALGTLDNGLAWFVEENDKPADRAELRLVVRVGSVVEDDDQLGLAHFLEHMAFNGSENFEGNALIEAMEAMGMDFGAHVNASTGFDLTTYTLTVPTDDPALLETGLRVLRDQAGGLLLEAEEIEAERGVVLEEWRGRQGAGSRITEELLAATFQGSRYAERQPIGTEESLRTFEHEALRRFYADWYRPDLMAVIAVGDFEAETVQQLVETHFSDLAGPEAPRERPLYEIPPREEPVVVVVTDAELPRSGVSISDQVDSPEVRTMGGYVALLARAMFFTALNERLGTLSQDPESTFVGAGAGWSRLNALEAEWQLSIGLREGQELEGIGEVMTEVERIRRHGLTEAEVKRARAAVAASYERLYREREKTSSAEHAAELIRVFSTDEGMPGTEAEYLFARTWLPRIGKEEVDLVGQDFLQRGSPVVKLVMPDKEGLAVPEADAVWARIAEVEALELAAPEEDAVEGPLLEPLPPEGQASIVERGELSELGVTTWVLSNGVTVWLKPTDFQDDQILLRATSPGGLSLVPDAEYIPASSALAIRANSGIGAYDATDLRKRLRGTRAAVGTSIARFGEGLSGGAPPDELEAMLQLVTLHMTQPLLTEEGQARFRRNREEALRNRLSDPGAVFSDVVTELSWEPSVRITPWTLETLDQLDLEVSREFYEGRFANAADFTFLFVGNLDLEAHEPLIVRYLGNLPASEEREAWADDGLRRREGRLEETVRAGKEPRAVVQLTWHGPFEDSWVRRNRLQALGDILSVRLREVLREDLGGVYGVSAGGDSSARPLPEYTFSISFGCDPERVDELVAASLAEVARIVAEPVSAEEIATEQEKNRRQREESVRTNGFWAGAISGALARGEDPLALLDYDARNDSLSAAEVQAMAAEVFSEEASFLRAVLLPEDPAAGP